MTGQRFGKLVVLHLDEHPTRKSDIKSWICKCDCGKIVSVSGNNLRAGRVTDCGSHGRKEAGNRRAIIQPGQKWGMLTILELDHVDPAPKPERWYKCRCDCGQICIKRGSLIRKHQTTSCGCYGIKVFNAHIGGIGEKIKTHGDSYGRLYRIYQHMIERCYRETSRVYPNYGGRGIHICSDWYNPDLTKWKKHRAGNPGYLAFKEWAYTNGYYDQPKNTKNSDLISIDRIDPNGPYAPWNCRWITMREQAANKRDTLYISVGHDQMTIQELIDGYQLPITYAAVLKQIKRGWSADAIIYAARHPDLGIIWRKGAYRDKDGFIRLIPSITNNI